METAQKRVRDIIAKKGVSIYQVAQGIGADHANLYRSLADGSNIELNTLLKVLDYLGYELQFTKLKKSKGNKMRFRVDNDYNLVSYDPDVWQKFPGPGEQNSFRLQVRGDEYVTWKRKLESLCTSFAKILDPYGNRITHRVFCTKYGLRRGDNFEVEVVEEKKSYKVII